MWEDSRRRRPKKSQIDRLLEAQKGKCWGCKKSFARMGVGVKPQAHHLTGDPKKKSPITSLVLLCPNCHSQQHTLKSVKKTDDLLGIVEERKTKVVRKSMTAPIKRKQRKDKGKKRKKGFWD